MDLTNIKILLGKKDDKSEDEVLAILLTHSIQLVNAYLGVAEIPQSQRSSPRSEGSEFDTRLPSLGVLRWEERLALRTSRACVWESWEVGAIGNRFCS